MLPRTDTFDLHIFEQRYREELLPYLFGSVSEADLTFDDGLRRFEKTGTGYEGNEI